MSIKFSVVINTYNRAKTLAATLDSLRYLRHDNFEVVVVNGPSTDDTQLILETYKEFIRVGCCPETNLSKSRNIGIAMAAGDVVCFIDDDAVPEPDWLNKIESGYSEPSVGAVGGFIRDNTGVTFQSKVVVCDRFGNAENFEAIEKADVKDEFQPYRYFSLTGTNSSFKREVLLQMGGFDEEYAYFLDETDVIVRMIDAGYKVKYIPDAEIHHKYAESHLRNSNKIPKSIYFCVRSKAYFCVQNATKHFDLNIIFEFLRKYQSNLKKNKKWYLQSGLIESAHYEKLIQEIDQGVLDGIKDAFTYLNRRLMSQLTIKTWAGGFKACAPKLASQNRLKICFLSQQYPPKNCGGIGIWTHELATSLAMQGHEVSVVTCGEQHPTVDFIQGVWVHRIIPTSHTERTFPVLPDLPQTIKDYAYTAYDEVIRIRDRRGLDIVSTPIWDVEGIACVADKSLITILSLHSTAKLVLPSKLEWLENVNYKKMHVDKIIQAEEWVLKNANHIVANSKAILADIESAYAIKIPQEKFSIVPHGVSDVEACQTVLHSNQINKNKIRLLYVGRFEKRKGIDLLLTVLPRLLEQFSNLEVWLVGDNEIDGKDSIKNVWLNELREKHYLNRVFFTGLVSNEELQVHYKECDIFVAPSRYESFGLIYIEAMRYGKAIIGTQVGGIPEIITHGKDGLLVELENTEDLYQKISCLLDNPDMRTQLGQLARETFLSRFTNEHMRNEIIEMYKCLLNTSS